jgi:hypothetical protein
MRVEINNEVWILKFHFEHAFKFKQKKFFIRNQIKSELQIILHPFPYLHVTNFSLQFGNEMVEL